LAPVDLRCSEELSSSRLPTSFDKPLTTKIPQRCGTDFAGSRLCFFAVYEDQLVWNTRST